MAAFLFIIRQDNATAIEWTGSRDGNLTTMIKEVLHFKGYTVLNTTAPLSGNLTGAVPVKQASEVKAQPAITEPCNCVKH